jgi:hypothetical protein
MVAIKPGRKDTGKRARRFPVAVEVSDPPEEAVRIYGCEIEGKVMNRKFTP